jgi:hypothetical protein
VAEIVTGLLPSSNTGSRHRTTLTKPAGAEAAAIPDYVKKCKQKNVEGHDEAKTQMV